MSADIVPCTPAVQIVGRLGGYTVYGWTAELVDSDGRRLPLRLFVSMHLWRRRAHQAARRWLEDAWPLHD